MSDRDIHSLVNRIRRRRPTFIGHIRRWESFKYLINPGNLDERRYRGGGGGGYRAKNIEHSCEMDGQTKREVLNL